MQVVLINAYLLAACSLWKEEKLTSTDQNKTETLQAFSSLETVWFWWLNLHCRKREIRNFAVIKTGQKGTNNRASLSEGRLLGSPLEKHYLLFQISEHFPRAVADPIRASGMFPGPQSSMAPPWHPKEHPQPCMAAGARGYKGDCPPSITPCAKVPLEE